MKSILQEIDKLQSEINEFRPLDAHLRSQIKEYYRIGLTYSSNALEGNSLTESETKVVIEEGITIGGKQLKEHFEALGHSEAFDLIYQLAQEKFLKENDIKKLHKFFYYRIDESQAGKYRKVKALITGSKYPLPAPQELSVLITEFVARLSEMRSKKHPVESAALAHKEFVFIHPFVDGNGRIARLIMNLILLQSGYTIAIIPPVLRNEYIQTLERAHTDDINFIEFIARCVRETQRDYLRLFK